MPLPASAWSDEITLELEPYDGDAARLVVAEAEAELVARYGMLDGGERDLTAAMFSPPSGCFLVARSTGGRPVGGAGVHTVRPGVGAVRRVWVHPEWRGRGLGRRIMGALEVTAGDLGLRELELATGFRQPEAVALYRATGWERLFTDRHGVALPEWIICFRKPLTRQDP